MSYSVPVIKRLRAKPAGNPAFDLAEACCRIGDSLLERARRQRKPASELIEACASQYLRALQQGPNVHACLGLAQLAYYWGSLADALRLLNQARALEPAHPDLPWLTQVMGCAYELERKQQLIGTKARASLEQQSKLSWRERFARFKS